MLFNFPTKVITPYTTSNTYQQVPPGGGGRTITTIKARSRNPDSDDKRDGRTRRNSIPSLMGGWGG